MKNLWHIKVDQLYAVEDPIYIDRNLAATYVKIEYSFLHKDLSWVIAVHHDTLYYGNKI